MDGIESFAEVDRVRVDRWSVPRQHRPPLMMRLVDAVDLKGDAELCTRDDVAGRVGTRSRRDRRSR